MASLVDSEHFKEELRSLLLEGYNVEEDFSELYEYISNLDNPKSVLDHVRVFKEEGNWLFKKGDLDGALENYGLAGVYITTVILEDKNDLLSFNDLACCICLNMAACLLKKKEFMQVGQLCSIVLNHNPDNVKAHYRRALAALELNRYDLAFWDLKLALGIEPFNREVEKTFSKVKALFHSSTKDHVQEPIGLGAGVALPKKVSINKPLKENGEHFNICKKESYLNDAHMKDSGLDEKEVTDTNLEESSIDMPPKEEDSSSIVDMNNDLSTKVLTSKDEEIGEGSCREGMNINISSMEVERVNVAEKEDSNQSEIGSNYENGCMMHVELNHFKNESPKCKEYDNTSSSTSKQRDLAEPKYRFYNRRRRGSTIMISKNDYLLLAQGKTLSFYNSKSCSYLQVKVPGVQNASEASTNSCVSYSNGGNEDDGSAHLVANLTSLDKESDITSDSSSLISSSVNEEEKKGHSSICGGKAFSMERSCNSQFCFSSVRKKVLKRKHSVDLPSNHKHSKSNRQVFGSKTKYSRPSDGASSFSTNFVSSCRLKHSLKRKCSCSHDFNLCINLMERPQKKMKTSLCRSSNVCNNVDSCDVSLVSSVSYVDCKMVNYSLDGGI